MKLIKFSLLTMTILLTAACHTQKGNITNNNNNNNNNISITTADMQPQAILDAIAQRQLPWTYMQAGGSVKLISEKKLSSSMQIRMIRDKAIYISIRPMLGIEIAKMVITNDSLFVVDKYHKRYLAEPLSIITNGIPVTVSNMQDIFLGRAFLLNSGTLTKQNKDLATIQTDDNKNKIVPVSQPDLFSYAFSLLADNSLTAVEVTPKKGKPYTANYDEITNTLVGPIARETNIAAEVGGKKFTLELSLKSPTWNEEISIDYKIPTSYTRINGKKLASMLGD